MITYSWGPGDWGGTYYPLIICDACLRPVDDGAGNTYWLVLDDGAIHPRLWHTHKGMCAQLDDHISDTHGGMVMSEELDRWLSQLLHNVKHPLPPRKQRSR